MYSDAELPDFRCLLCYRCDAMTTIPIAQVEAAINRARAAHPACGAESALSLEVSVLAGLYGRMIYERLEQVELGSLSTAERVALELWLPPAGLRADDARTDDG